jgi:hypothetical protein
MDKVEPKQISINAVSDQLRSYLHSIEAEVWADVWAQDLYINAIHDVLHLLQLEWRD